MKKSVALVLAAFAAFLALGIWVNAQRGQYFGEEFWSAQGGGVYSGGPGQHVSFAVADGETHFTLSLNGLEREIIMSSPEEGWLRLDFSDGWAALLPDDSHGEPFGTFYGGDDRIVLTDIEAMGLRFSRATGKERYVFYGEDDEPAGESLHMVTESGDSIYMGEVWYDETDESAPEKRIVTLENGAILGADDWYSNDVLYQNPRGEYLLDDWELFNVETGGAAANRTQLARFLVSIARGEDEQRGAPVVALAYVLVYAIGAAAFLWPQKMAFFGSRWMYRDQPELSDEGIFVQKCGGVLGMGAAVLILFLPVMRFV